MSNPTSNFGWQMPTPTDLVTDLPADFEVFGQAVDSSLADLKGGTSGQILSKATNTDMDFVWITNDQGDITGITATSPLTGGGTSGAVTVGIQSATTSQSGAVQLSDSTSTTSSVLAATPTAVKSAYDLAAAAIPKSTVTAKGSIVAASASSTPAQLAVGNNGETLVADSSTSTGLRYQPSTGRNFALNSDFTIWQRGTTITPTTNGGAYCADRWFITRGSNTSITATQQTAGNLSTTPNQAFRYYARVQRTAASTTTSNVDFGQMFETSQVTLLAGQTVTFSGYIRKGANFSATSDVIKMQIIEGTGTDQKQMDGGYTGGAYVVDTAKTLTSSWQRFSVTGTVATTSTEITIKFSYTPTGTAGANDYFDVVGAQLELGSVPTAWNLATGTLQGELAACQRYYVRILGNTAGTTYSIGTAYSTTLVECPVPLPVPMRVYPTSFDYASLRIYQGASNYNSGTFALATNGSTTMPMIDYTHGSAVFTAGYSVQLTQGTTTPNSIGFSAEL